MAELEPHLHAPLLEDPAITRLLLRRTDDGRHTQLLERAGAVAASLSVVVPVGGAAGEPTVASFEDWSPSNLRLEFLVVESDDDAGRSVMRERLARSNRSWRTVERPPGGRAAALSAAAVAVDHEFMLVGTGGRTEYADVQRALSLMWVEGADAALIAAGPDDRDDPEDAVDPSATLSAWLGLRGPVPPGRLVILRRWVARWLLNEITRAISPAAEVADRTRLMGIGIVQLVTFPSDGPLPGS